MQSGSVFNPYWLWHTEQVYFTSITTILPIPLFKKILPAPHFLNCLTPIFKPMF